MYMSFVSGILLLLQILVDSVGIKAAHVLASLELLLQSLWHTHTDAWHAAYETPHTLKREPFRLFESAFACVFADGGRRMDAELGADSARRKMEAAGEALEIVPLEMYDSARAKIAANLRWLFAKAFGIGELVWLCLWMRTEK